MAGKKKKKDKKSKKTLDPNGPEAQIKRHEEALASMTERIVMEREYRHYYQLDRDKIMAFSDITKKEIEDIQAEVRNKEREKEEQDERHQVEIKVYKQKLRHLLYEQKITIDRLKIESENALKLQADEFRQKQAQLKLDKRALKQEFKEKELSQAETIKSMKAQHDKAVSQLREEYENRLKELQIKYQTKINQLRESMESKARKEAEEIEEKKNEQVRELMKKHDQEFQDIKNYYLIITTNNQVNIRTLKDDVARMKKNEATNEKLMFEIASENKRLSEPLSNALAEIAQLRKEVANHERDKVSLKNTKARLVVIEGQLKQLRWEHEILENSFKQTQNQRDSLYNKFESVLLDTQQKTLLKAQLLEAKSTALQENLEKKDSHIRQVLKATNLPQDAVANINLQDDLDKEKDSTLASLAFEINEVNKNFEDFYIRATKMLNSYGIPQDEVALALPAPSQFQAGEH